MLDIIDSESRASSWVTRRVLWRRKSIISSTSFEILQKQPEMKTKTSTTQHLRSNWLLLLLLLSLSLPIIWSPNSHYRSWLQLIADLRIGRVLGRSDCQSSIYDGSVQWICQRWSNADVQYSSGLVSRKFQTSDLIWNVLKCVNIHLILKTFISATRM